VIYRQLHASHVDLWSIIPIFFVSAFLWRALGRAEKFARARLVDLAAHAPVATQSNDKDVVIAPVCRGIQKRFRPGCIGKAAYLPAGHVRAMTPLVRVVRQYLSPMKKLALHAILGGGGGLDLTLDARRGGNSSTLF